MKFGEYLIEKNYLGFKEIDEALQVQAKYRRQKLGRILLELNYLDQNALNVALTRYLDNELPKNILKIQVELLKDIKSSQAQSIANKYGAIVFRENNFKIEYLVANLVDDELLANSEKITGKDASCWPLPQEIFNSLKGVCRSAKPNKSNIVVHSSLSDDDKINAACPFSKLFKQILTEAKQQLISDIHIEPIKSGVNIRFRQHGILSIHKVLEKEYSEGIISTIKNIVNMDLAIVGSPQDSRASFKTLKLNLRANSLPSLYGEKIALRLLYHGRKFNLNEAGLSPDVKKILRESIKKRDGIILISGPTGSGKTTTLYSLLGELPRKQLNILTLENPVEYELAGINQVNIREKGALTFNSALRALLRQDPDVIFIGEIRDQETADLAFRAASTGHLVLSTIHANGAKEVIERLTSLGVNDFSIKNNLRLSAAQRLLPKLCPHCSTEQNQSKTLNVKGCPHCQNGIVGRIAILEYMDRDDIRSFLASPSKHLGARHSLQQSAIELANKGLLDCKEVFSL